MTRATFVLAGWLLSACSGPSGAGPTSRPVELAPSRAASSPDDREGSRPAAPTYREVREELDRACDRAIAGSNIEMKEAMREILRCKRELVQAEWKLARAAGTWPDEQQRAFDLLVEDVCRLSEDSGWLHLETGLRDHGTLYGYAYMSCVHAMLDERMFVLRALAAGASEAIVARARAGREAADRAERELAELTHRLQSARPGDAAAAATAGMDPITEAELAEARTWAKRATEQARAIARGACQWRALADSYGGDDACQRGLRGYLVSEFEASPYDP